MGCALFGIGEAADISVKSPDWRKLTKTFGGDYFASALVWTTLWCPMAILFDLTIVSARDNEKSATFLAEMLACLLRRGGVCSKLSGPTMESTSIS
jgi:hypothetical protein